MPAKTITTLSVLFVLLLSGSILAAPLMELSESEFDFGYVPQNSKIAHDFWIYSIGDDSLKIVKVIPGCGCTKTPLEKTDLGVGDSSKLEIIFSTRRYTSKVTKHPRIQTNMGKPDKNVTILSTVVSVPDSTFPAVVKPYKLDMSQYGEKPVEKMPFRIDNVSDQPFDLKLIAEPSNLVKVDLPKTIKPGESGTAMVYLLKDAIDAEFEKSITIECSDSAKSRYTIPLKRSIIYAGEPQASQTSSKTP